MPRKKQSSKTLRRDAETAVQSCFAWTTRLAARRITQYFETALKGAGLGTAQFGLLILIAAADDDTLGALAVRAGLDPSTLSRNLRLLEKDGLVEIAFTAQDERRRVVWLTEAGARRLEAALLLWRQANDQLAQRFPPRLARDLRRALESLPDQP